MKKEIDYELKYNNIMKELDYVRNCNSDLKNKSAIEIIKYLIGVTESEGFP